MRKKNSKTFQKNMARKKRKWAIRNKISGTQDTPRLSVFRSLKNIGAQLIDDDDCKTLISISSNSKGLDLDRSKKKTEQSFEIGMKLGELAKGKGIKKVRFDRNGYLFHGRVKALADGARKAGLKF